MNGYPAMKRAIERMVVGAFNRTPAPYGPQKRFVNARRHHVHTHQAAR
jgi:hypothetical protein